MTKLIIFYTDKSFSRAVNQREIENELGYFHKVQLIHADNILDPIFDKVTCTAFSCVGFDPTGRELKRLKAAKVASDILPDAVATNFPPLWLIVLVVGCALGASLLGWI